MARCTGGCDIDYEKKSSRRITAKLRRDLEDYDLSTIVDSAIVGQNLNGWYRDKALLEYKHFLLMAFKSSKLRGKWGNVVPTKNADKIWHAHILHTREYMEFCRAVFGVDYVHHNPGLKEGTPEFERAVVKTQRLNESMGKYTIDTDYFGGNQAEPLTECSSCCT